MRRAGNLRFGRAFIYGPGILPNATTPSTNLQPDGRKNDGYVTDFSWGYRMRARLDYDGLAGGALRVSPSVVWNHDVDGVAMDGQFIEDRQTLGLGPWLSGEEIHGDLTTPGSPTRPTTR